MRVCTIVAKNYLAHARVLASSLHIHHPDAVVTVLIVDGDGGERDDEFETLVPADIGLSDDEFARMAAIYDLTELCCAVKPWLLATLVGRESSPVLYLDPDMEVLGPLGDLREAAVDHALVLTPHFLDPLPRDGRRPTEQDILISGTYNLGFLGVGPRSVPFLRWWQERLRRDCISDVANGLFVDQRWIDIAATIFGCFVVQDRGVNVAYWNVAQRPVVCDGASWFAGDVPLRLFHFSGYEPLRPEALTRHHPLACRTQLVDNPALAELCHRYGDQLRAAGYVTFQAEDYRFERSASGRKLDTEVRRRYRAALIEAESNGQSLPDVFAPAHTRAADAWLDGESSVRGLRRPGVLRRIAALFGGAGASARERR